jgi:hypothetical protein
VPGRTFFRMFESEEDVALAAELELWDAYVAEVANTELHGPVLESLKQTLVAAVTGLAASSPPAASSPASPPCGTAARSTPSPSKPDSSPNWKPNSASTAATTSDYGYWKGPGGGTVLIHRVEEAFAAIPDSITLAAP